MTPPVAVVSAVTLRCTGRLISTASPMSPPAASARKRTCASPSSVARAGHSNTAERSDSMRAVRSVEPSTPTPSASTATVMVRAEAVPLCTSVRSITSSPTRRKRGSAGRTTSGCVTRSSLVPSPTCVVPLTARACARHVVALSGRRSSKLALPFASVSSCPIQSAVLRKSVRSLTPLSPPPLPSASSGTLITSLRRSIDVESEEPVETPSERWNQNARSPSGPSSSASDSTAWSTMATETSPATPRPSQSVTVTS